MSAHADGSRPTHAVARPAIKGKRSISIVWIVPLVAVLIGAWLVYKAVTEKGPTITITFKSAEGLEVGKTKIKYKDGEVGKVTGIVLSEDLAHITVTAEMVPGAHRHRAHKIPGRARPPGHRHPPRLQMSAGQRLSALGGLAEEERHPGDRGKSGLSAADRPHHVAALVAPFPAGRAHRA